MIHAPLFDKHDPTTMVSTQWMSIYEVQLNHESKKSIPYFKEKNNPVKHILALCSILWQGNQEKVSERATKRHSINALPRYASQYGIAAKRCYRTPCRLLVLDRLVSVRQCQEMLQRRCI